MKVREHLPKVEQKASLSIYFLISSLCILSVIFTLLESIRLYGAAYFSSQMQMNVAESVFAAYDKELYDRYHLFAYSAYGEEEPDFDEVYETASLVADTSLQPESDGKSFWLRQTLADSEVSMYELATDHNGSALYMQMAQCAKEELLEDVITGLEDVAETVNEDNSEIFDTIETNAENALSAENTGEEPEASDMEYMQAASVFSEYGNPLISASVVKSHGILDLVIQDTSGLSEKTLAEGDLPSNRNLCVGNYDGTHESGFTTSNKALALRYIDKYFNSYTGDNAWGALDYEKEYLVAGKKSDEANLKSVVNRLLLVREGCNFVALNRDAEKVSEATLVATAIAILCMIPEGIDAIKQGILLAWAYGESILDLRTLLTGGKVSMIKTPAEWTLDLKSLGALSGSYMKAIPNEAGVSYDMYLISMLFMQNAKKQVSRIIDLIEANIRTIEGNEKFRIDMDVLSMELQLRYESVPLYLMFVNEIEDKPESYSFLRIFRYSYLDDS